MAKPLRRVIWAVDPFEHNAAIRQHCLAALRAMAKDTRLEVEVVHVMIPAEVDTVIFIYDPGYLKDFARDVEKKLRVFAKKTGLKAIKGVRVLRSSEGSRKGGVRALVDHARKSRANLILTGTHAGKKVSKIVLGSFAETLLYRSDTPVLIVGEKSRKPSRMNHVLFPTDFSAESFKSFKTLIRTFGHPGMTVTLLNHVVRAAEPLATSALSVASGYALVYRSWEREDKKAKEKKAAQWARVGEKARVRVPFEYVESTREISTEVTRTARRLKVSCIAMASESGPISAAILGSVTRHVVREADCPVWIVHPNLTRPVPVTARKPARRVRKK